MLKNGQTSLGIINTFEVFGELNFLEPAGSKTSASVVAMTDVEVRGLNVASQLSFYFLFFAC